MKLKLKIVDSKWFFKEFKTCLSFVFWHYNGMNESTCLNLKWKLRLNKNYWYVCVLISKLTVLYKCALIFAFLPWLIDYVILSICSWWFSFLLYSRISRHYQNNYFVYQKVDVDTERMIFFKSFSSQNELIIGDWMGKSGLDVSSASWLS